MKSAATIAALSTAVLIVAGVTAYRIHSTSAFFSAPALLSRFPTEDALVLQADFATLRRAGLLGDSKAPLDPDYKQFRDATGFDYKRDLDSLIASFSRSGTFFIARGRFNWKKLRDYARQHGGSCYEDLCRMQGSTPERHISFLPLRSDALALAVSSNDLAATALTKTAPPITTPLPAAPVWISVSGAELRRQSALPPTMHLMLSALTRAERVVITLGPGGTQGIEAQLQATCNSQDDAKVLASQLRSTTGLLKEALARDKSAADDQVTAMLTQGTFNEADRRVIGNWPVRKSLLEALSDGL